MLGLAILMPGTREIIAQSITETWADKAVKLRYEDLAPEVAERVKLCILDAIGVMLYTSSLDESKLYLTRPLAQGGAAEAVVWGINVKLPLETAGACNTYLIHGHEIDDGDTRAGGGVHPTCVVAGSALAVAEYTQASGKDLILACALGYNMMGRLVAAMMPPKTKSLHARGFMPTAITGPGSAAIVAAKLMKMDAQDTADAIGIALGGGSGLFQYLFDQTEDKKVHVSRATRTGLEAVMLASQGLPGPRRIIEGKAGLLNAYQCPTEPETLVGGFDTMDAVLDIQSKFYSCAAPIIPVLDALESLVLEHKFTAREVDNITLQLNGLRIPKSALANINNFKPPVTVTGAQLNINFTLALYLYHKGTLVHAFTANALKDQRVLALANKVACNTDGDGNGSIQVTLSDGRKLTAPIQGKAKLPVPHQRDRRIQKFKELTAQRLSPTQQDKVIQMVDQLETVENISDWAAEINGFLTPHTKKTSRRRR